MKSQVRAGLRLVVTVLAFAIPGCGEDDSGDVGFDPEDPVFLAVAECCKNTYGDAMLFFQVSKYRTQSMEVNAALTDGTGGLIDVTDDATWSNGTPNLVTLSATSKACAAMPSRRCRTVTNRDNRPGDRGQSHGVVPRTRRHVHRAHRSRQPAVSALALGEGFGICSGRMTTATPPASDLKEQLRATLATELLDEKPANIPRVCESLGLQPGDAEESRTQRVRYVQRYACATSTWRHCSIHKCEASQWSRGVEYTVTIFRGIEEKLSSRSRHRHVASGACTQ